MGNRLRNTGLKRDPRPQTQTPQFDTVEQVRANVSADATVSQVLMVEQMLANVSAEMDALKAHHRKEGVRVDAIYENPAIEALMSQRMALSKLALERTKERNAVAANAQGAAKPSAHLTSDPALRRPHWCAPFPFPEPARSPCMA
jgi:hypothetical protein